jgi:hypothetical protein
MKTENSQVDRKVTSWIPFLEVKESQNKYGIDPMVSNHHLNKYYGFFGRLSVAIPPANKSKGGIFHD